MRQRAGDPAGAVYGTLVAAGQLAIESAAGTGTGTMAASLTATLLVFWLAHAYTDTLGSMIGRPDDPPTLVHALRAEWPIAESAALPLVALAVCAAAGARPATAGLVALLVAVAELAGWAVLAARRARLRGVRRVLYCAVVTVLGLALIGLKYAIH